MRVRKKVVDSDDEDKGVSDKKKKRNNVHNKRKSDIIDLTNDHLGHFNNDTRDNQPKRQVELDENFDNNNNVIDTQSVYHNETTNELMNVVNVAIGCVDDFVNEILKLPIQVYNEIYDQLVGEKIDENIDLNLTQDRDREDLAENPRNSNANNGVPNNNSEESEDKCDNENLEEDIWNIESESVAFNPDEFHSVNEEYETEQDTELYNEYINKAIDDAINTENFKQIQDIDTTQPTITEFNGFSPDINFPIFTENGPENYDNRTSYDTGPVNFEHRPANYESPINYDNELLKFENMPASFENVPDYGIHPVNFHLDPINDPIPFLPYDGDVPYISELLPDYITEQHRLFNSLDPFTFMIPAPYKPPSPIRYE